MKPSQRNARSLTRQVGFLLLVLLIAAGPRTAGAQVPGGTPGQIIINTAPAIGNWFTPDLYNIASNAAADCSGATATVLSTVIGTHPNALIPPGCTIKVSANDTIPSGKTLRISCGATVQITTGVTLTINAFFADPGICTLFTWTGSGKVIGIAKVRPEWWGAGPGVADSGPLIQLAVNSMQAAVGASSSERSVNFACTTYNVVSEIFITPTNAINPKIRGCNDIGATILLCKSTFSGGDGACVHILGSPGLGSLANWEMRDLSIQNETHDTGATTGLLIGSSNSDQLAGFHQNLVENVHVSGFANQIVVQNAQFIDFRRISVSPGDNTATEAANTRGITIQNTASSVFTGSINVSQSKLTGSGHNSTCTGYVVLIISNGPSGIAGIHFNDNEWYGGVNQLLMTTSAGNISDIWVNPGNQFEGPVSGGCYGIVGTVVGSGVQLFDIHVQGAYLSGHGFFRPIQFSASSSATMFGLFLNNNFIPNPIETGIVVYCIGAAAGHSITITGNQIITPTVNTGVDAIYVDSCKQGNYSNNMLSGGTIGTPSRRSVVLANGCDYVTMVGNNSGGLTSGNAAITGGTCTHAVISGNNP